MPLSRNKPNPTQSGDRTSSISNDPKSKVSPSSCRDVRRVRLRPHRRERVEGEGLWGGRLDLHPIDDNGLQGTLNHRIFNVINYPCPPTTPKRSDAGKSINDRLSTSWTRHSQGNRMRTASHRSSIRWNWKVVRGKGDGLSERNGTGCKRLAVRMST